LELQIDAHIGGVNDIAFSHPNKTLSVITCGDDKLIKVRILCDLLFFSQNKKEHLEYIRTLDLAGVGCSNRTKAVHF